MFEWPLPRAPVATFFPIADDDRALYKPCPVTWILLVANVVVFFIQLARPEFTDGFAATPARSPRPSMVVNRVAVSPLFFFRRLADDVPVKRCAFPMMVLTCLVAWPIFGQMGEPSDFRVFSDKQGKSIEARILAVSEDRRTIRMRGRDDSTFETAINGLSLDDQQFVRDWLIPDEPGLIRGKVRVFGVLPEGAPIDTSALAATSEVRSVHAAKGGWLVHLENGEVKSFQDKFPKLKNIRYLGVNTVWIAAADLEGKALRRTGDIYHKGLLDGVIEVDAGSGHHIGMRSDGTVKVWGGGYGSGELRDPPVVVADAVAVATTQGEAAVVDSQGLVHVWSPKKGEARSREIGDGVEAIDGGIFHFVVLTRSGEVYEWAGADPGGAQVPSLLVDKGPFRKIRTNGATRAAQREDGTWIAWGMNGAGIVDHINQLGATEDLDFFSEPGKKKHGYVIWVEPET